MREQYIDRIEVLDKVKALMMLPDIQLATTEQVANFYEVDSKSILMILNRHSDELNSDGYSVWKAENFKSNNLLPFKNNHWSRGF